MKDDSSYVSSNENKEIDNEDNKNNKNNKKNKYNKVNKNNIFNEDNGNNRDNGDKPKKKEDFTNCTLFSKYKVKKKLTEGNFSYIYLATNDNGDNFCCKIEPINSPQLLLEDESKIMDYLRGPYIPSIKLYGKSGEYNILIMQLLGKSLDYYIKKLEKFSIKTTVMLACQMIDILQYIHTRHIIHRDIKPGNFVMGLGKSNLDLFIIDFGFAKKYRSNKTANNYPMKKGYQLTGTARFSSIHAMKGLEQSCRDDLESLAYVLYFFLIGRLPWQGIKEKSKEELYQKILDKKMKIKSEELGQNLPIQFCEFLEYSRNLKYREQPNYNLFKKKIKDIICVDNDESKFDKIYDWIDKQKVEREKNKDKNNNREIETVKSTCCRM